MKDKCFIPMAQEIVIPRSFLEAWKHRKANLNIEGFWPALESAFNEVNGKATRFTIGPLDVVDSIMRCEERLKELKVAWHKRPDHIALVRQSAGASMSYRYGSIGTCYQVTVIRGNSWRLDYVKRVTVSPGAQGGRAVLMNEEMYMHAARTLLPDVRILQSAPAIGETK
jgi:hypothetical protein